MAGNAQGPTGAPPADASGDPPYKCEVTGESGICLRFNRNPVTGEYDLPPGGIRMPCSQCENFFC
jgi:hypothetical protein